MDALRTSNALNDEMRALRLAVICGAVQVDLLMNDVGTPWDEGNTVGHTGLLASLSRLVVAFLRTYNSISERYLFQLDICKGLRDRSPT